MQGSPEYGLGLFISSEKDTVSTKQVSYVKEILRTIANIGRLDDIEFFFDIRVKQTIEIETVGSLFPAREISYFVSVNDVALCP